METPHEADDGLRRELWARIRARRHWMVALTEVAWDLTAVFLAAIDAQADAGAPKVRVDGWDLVLTEVDPDTGATTDYGILRIMSWPRAALAPETMHAIVQAQGSPLSIAQLLEVPILVPAPQSVLWHLGEQLKALSAWLQAEEDDEDDDEPE